jgi:hypothetical protein
MYGTLVDFRSYATARGDNAPTAATDDVATAALVRASDYIRTRYVLRMELDTPETDGNVIEATYIAARREIATPGFWTTTFSPAQAKTLVEVKGIKWQPIGAKEFGLSGRDLVAPMDPAIDALLRPYGDLPGTMVV